MPPLSQHDAFLIKSFICSVYHAASEFCKCSFSLVKQIKRIIMSSNILYIGLRGIVWTMRIGFLVRILLNAILRIPGVLGRTMTHIFKVRFDHHISLKQRTKCSNTFALIFGLALLSILTSSFIVDSSQSHSIIRS